MSELFFNVCQRCIIVHATGYYSGGIVDGGVNTASVICFMRTVTVRIMYRLDSTMTYIYTKGARIHVLVLRTAPLIPALDLLMPVQLCIWQLPSSNHHLKDGGGEGKGGWNKSTATPKKRS